jgi:hypothetical protein
MHTVVEKLISEAYQDISQNEISYKVRFISLYKNCIYATLYCSMFSIISFELIILLPSLSFVNETATTGK